MPDLKFEIVESPFMDARELSVVQVQPREVSFEDDDSEERRRVISTVVNWMLGGPAPELEITSSTNDVTPGARRPSEPWMLCFPEIYVPLDAAIDLCKLVTAGQVVMGGIVPTPKPGRAAPWLFDEADLRDLARQLATVATLKNAAFLDELAQTIRAQGGGANVAISLVGTNARPDAIVHAKVAPSKFEIALIDAENTTPADSVYALELVSGNRGVLVLPLICSDFFVPRPDSGQTVLQEWDRQRRLQPVDLISVVNVQPISNDRGAWPEDVTRALLSIMTDSLPRYLRDAHVVLTNVGRTAGRHPQGCGASSFVIRGVAGKEPSTHLEWLKWFATDAWLFADAHRTDEAHLRQRQWFLASDAFGRLVVKEAPALTMLTLRQPARVATATLQSVRLRFPRQRGKSAATHRAVLRVEGDDVLEETS